jgi:hypothetical protein
VSVKPFACSQLSSAVTAASSLGVYGEEYLIEAYDPNNDLRISHTLFLTGTVQIVGGVPQGTPIFNSPIIFLARSCGTPTYNPNTPGFARTVSGHEALSQADPIGLITFSWQYGISC